MSSFQPEKYIIASSIDEALTTLQRLGDRARLIAGGTTIHELAAHDLMLDVSTLVDITELNMNFVITDSDAIRIGATTTFAELLKYASAEHSTELAVVVDALRSIRPMQVRNVGTVGGSLCCSVPFFDLPPALTVLDAQVHVVGSSGDRVIPIDAFFVDYFTSSLGAGEIVTEISIPRRGTGSSGAFRKLETNSVDWALVSVAINARMDEGGLHGVRVALGGAVGPAVVRARHVESALEGHPWSEEAGELSVGLMDQDVNPRTDFRATGEYRLHMARVYTRRCLAIAVARMME